MRKEKAIFADVQCIWDAIPDKLDGAIELIGYETG